MKDNSQRGDAQNKKPYETKIRLKVQVQQSNKIDNSGQDMYP